MDGALKSLATGLLKAQLVRQVAHAGHHLFFHHVALAEANAAHARALARGGLKPLLLQNELDGVGLNAWRHIDHTDLAPASPVGAEGDANQSAGNSLHRQGALDSLHFARLVQKRDQEPCRQDDYA